MASVLASDYICSECSYPAVAFVGENRPVCLKHIELPPTWGQINGRPFGEQAKLDQAVLDAAEKAVDASKMPYAGEMPDFWIAMYALEKVVRARREGLK